MDQKAVVAFALNDPLIGSGLSGDLKHKARGRCSHLGLLEGPDDLRPGAGRPSRESRQPDECSKEDSHRLKEYFSPD